MPALEPRQVQVPELRPKEALASELGRGLVRRSEPVPERGWMKAPGQVQDSAQELLP